MAKIIEPGRVCVKLTGRDAGKLVVITKVVNDAMVLVKSGARKHGQSERKCAVKHIEATPRKIDVGNEKEVQKILASD